MDIQLEKNECIFFICMVMLNKLILNLPTVIINETGTGSIINLIYVGFFAFTLIWFINRSFKKFPNCDLLDISKYTFGNYFKVFVGIIYILLFFLTLLTFLIDFSILLKRIYYNYSPMIFILLFFIIGILASNLIGFKSIIRIITLMFPFVLLSIFLSFVRTFDNFRLENLTPIFGYNYKTTFLNGLLNIFCFSFIEIYYFLPPLLKNIKDYKSITYISFFICSALLCITICTVLTLLPLTTNSITINPLYLLSRNVNLSSFLQRLDGLFVLFWILALLSYLSSLLFFINLIYSKISGISERAMFSYIVCIFLLGFAIYPFDVSIIQFLESEVLKYSIITITFVFSPAILICGCLKKKGQSKNAL